MLKRSVESYKRRHFLFVFTAILLLVILLLFVFFGKNIFGYIGINFDEIPGSDYLEIKDLFTNNSIQDQDKSLNIFNQKTNASAEHQGEPIIYPGASGFFDMLIYNRTKSSMEVEMFLSDINKDKVNIMYRVLVDDIYHYGDRKTYVSMADMAESIYRIMPPQNYMKVTIEWKWVTISDELDTAIGSKPRSQYILNLKVNSSKYSY